MGLDTEAGFGWVVVSTGTCTHQYTHMPLEAACVDLEIPHARTSRERKAPLGTEECQVAD